MDIKQANIVSMRRMGFGWPGEASPAIDVQPYGRQGFVVFSATNISNEPAARATAVLECADIESGPWELVPGIEFSEFDAASGLLQKVAVRPEACKPWLRLRTTPVPGFDGGDMRWSATFIAVRPEGRNASQLV